MSEQVHEWIAYERLRETWLKEVARSNKYMEVLAYLVAHCDHETYPPAIQSALVEAVRRAKAALGMKDE